MSSQEGKASGLVIRKVSISQKEYEDLKKQKEAARLYQRKIIKLEGELSQLKKKKEINLILELLPVVDDFERAIKAAEERQDYPSLLLGNPSGPEGKGSGEIREPRPEVQPRNSPTPGDFRGCRGFRKDHGDRRAPLWIQNGWADYKESPGSAGFLTLNASS